MATPAESYVNKGIYTLSEAAKILNVGSDDHITSQTLRRWCVGNAQSQKVLLSKTSIIEQHTYISFLQMVESRVIHAFRQHGVSMRTVRATLNVLSERYQVDSPFALRQLWTDGRDVFTNLVPSALRRSGMTATVVTHEIQSGQGVFAYAHDYLQRIIEYSEDTDLAERLWPLGRDGGVVVDPRRSFGVPTLTGTRVSTSTVVGMIGAGESLEVTADWFGVPVSAVEAAVRFEQKLAA